MQSIHNIKEPLTELNNMIGMNGLKDSIVDQIIYFVQNLHVNKNAVNPDFMHTCIYGPPGTGKTEIAKIMGKIFSSLGVLNKKYFKKVTRADLIAGYLGQTAMKTRDVIKDALGGVLFIDEAYALGNPEKRDSFAKECIDTLCEGLSDHKDKLMVIIAGYEEDLKKCFFAYNQGLNSRFPWRFKTDDYKAGELNKIFQKKVIDAGWSLKEEIPDTWFEPKMDTFKFYGRDMETLLSKTKIAHGRRVFCKPKDEKTKIVMKDIEKGYKMFVEVGDKNDNNSTKNLLHHMYL
jgi:SpoVK/Ycf46/Vps4 family AAA+-type ATPase